MVNDTWTIRWREQLSETYLYGSEIEFHENGTVSFSNRLMPPGAVIHRWYSKTNYQRQRVEPSLPLIDGESAYSLTANIRLHDESGEMMILRIIFYDRNDVQVDSVIIRDGKAFFKPSVRTYSYCVELINGGNANFTFQSLVLEEVSREAFDEEQKRIEKIKEASYKSKKKRRKSKKHE